MIDRHSLDELQAAVAETTDIEVDHLEPVYRELGIALDVQVRRRFEDVKTSITQWSVSRRFLDEEIAELTERLRSRRSERARLGEDQARLLRDLAEGGTPEALTSVQTTLGREEAALQRSASPLRSGTDPRSKCPADHREKHGTAAGGRHRSPGAPSANRRSHPAVLSLRPASLRGRT
ncbi:ABC-three component system protein [Streptomyces sp. NPDC056638]|uniref:ABC-three component system protein n=1 Tax=Streptomyces sp. NPDC056638 TaxID=3345887 RepID=UPI0036C01AF4